MPDFQIMHWYVAVDGPWTADAARQFREGGYDALVLLPDESWQPADLAFAHELDGLRSLDYTYPLDDDLAAFELPGLENLRLTTFSTRPIPPGKQLAMKQILITSREGVDVAGRWPELEHLRIADWGDENLELLDGAGTLTRVHLNGRHQRGTLTGLASCPGLESLTISNFSVVDSEALRDMTRLTELKLLAGPPTPPHAAIDLADVASSGLERLWIAHADGVRNLEYLLESPPQEIRLIDCKLTDNDQELLARLPEWVLATVADG